MIAVGIKLLLGCLLLCVGANRFIKGAAVLAKKFNWPPLVVGVIFIGFATSLPEFIVTIFAALKGSAAMAVGNAIGSNIANFGFVLGITALVRPLRAKGHILGREFSIVFIVTLLVGILLVNLYLSRLDGILLLVLLGAYLIFMWRGLTKDKQQEACLMQEFSAEAPKVMSAKRALFWWLVGMVMVLGGAELLVSGAVRVAHNLHIQDLVIGLTVVAVGTSLPELAGSVVSAWHRDADMVFGNILGSSIFNITAVLMIPAFLTPTKISSVLLYRDYPFMVGMLILAWLLAFFPPARRQLGRFAGGILLLAFLGYLALLLAW